MLASGKVDVAINNTGLTNGATGTGMIDTYECDFMTLDVVMTTSNTTSNNPATLKLTESDDTVLTNAVTFGATGDTDFTIPAANTGTENIYKFNVDLRGRKRYIFLSVSPTTTQTVSAYANLLRRDELPDSANDAGADILHEL